MERGGLDFALSLLHHILKGHITQHSSPMIQNIQN